MFPLWPAERRAFSGTDFGDRIENDLPILEIVTSAFWCRNERALVAIESTYEGTQNGSTTELGSLSPVTCPVTLWAVTSEAETVRFNVINPETNNRINMVTVDAGTREEPFIRSPRATRC